MYLDVGVFGQFDGYFDVYVVVGVVVIQVGDVLVVMGELEGVYEGFCGG